MHMKLKSGTIVDIPLPNYIFKIHFDFLNINLVMKHVSK